MASICMHRRSAPLSSATDHARTLLMLPCCTFCINTQTQLPTTFGLLAAQPRDAMGRHNSLGLAPCARMLWRG